MSELSEIREIAKEHFGANLNMEQLHEVSQRVAEDKTLKDTVEQYIGTYGPDICGIK